MALASGLCVLLGLWPQLLYRGLPFGSSYHPYTASHVVQSLQLLLWTGLAFVLLKELIKPKSGLILDTDWLYRRPLARGIGAFSDGLKKLDTNVQLGLARMATGLADRLGESREQEPIGHPLTWMVAMFLLVCIALI